MKIIFWSDFNCPYSYIGNTRLKNAVNDLGLDVEFEMKSFELEPNATSEVSSPTPERFAKKYGISLKEAEAQIAEIDQLGKNEGLNFNYGKTKLTSSLDAHRLVKYAQAKYPQNVAGKIIEKIFHAYFCENKIISDHNLLIEIATSSGISADEAENLLKSKSYEIEVRIDEEDAQYNGIFAVPGYVIYNGDDRLIIPGAFSTEEFKIALKDMISGEIESKTWI